MARNIKKWSQHVTNTSDTLDLKAGAFKQKYLKKIARSLKIPTSTANTARDYRSL